MSPVTDFTTNSGWRPPSPAERMMVPDLGAVCQTCRKLIGDGTGSIWLKGADLAAVQESAQAWEQRTDENPFVGWMTFIEHCPGLAPWRTSHDACDDLASAVFAIPVEQCRSWADLAHWTGYLLTKKQWAHQTDWGRLLRDAYKGSDSRLSPTVDPGPVPDPAARRTLRP
jgi:hypothetical protein